MIQVNALLSVNEGAHFGGVNQPFVAEKLRLGPQGATSLVVRLIATAPGLKNITGECLHHSHHAYIRPSVHLTTADKAWFIFICNSVLIVNFTLFSLYLNAF